MKPQKIYPVEYGEFYYIQDGTDEYSNNLLDAECVGAEQAKKNAERLCELWNNQEAINKLFERILIQFAGTPKFAI